MSSAQRDAPGASFKAAHHPEKPSARAQTAQGRTWSLSVAIPGSIVTNAQTMELRAWLAGQVRLLLPRSTPTPDRSTALPLQATAKLGPRGFEGTRTQVGKVAEIGRTSAIFSVCEIVVYRDAATAQPTHKPRGKYRDPGGEDGGKEEEDPSTFLARILEYLETPQYLRKALFPLHPSLRLAGLLPPLDCPHHLRRDDASPFREGVVVSTSSSDERPNKKRKGGHGEEATSGRVMVDVGLWDPIEATGGEGVANATRVTVRMPSPEAPLASLVPPSIPTAESGLYWGYRVRVADSLAQVFSECPYENDGGYDISIGTSERGTPIEDILEELPPFRHLLLTLGPLSGLELTIAADPLIPLEAEEASDLFDHWINVVEGQGSRTVRTEEALPIALARLKSTVERKGIP